MMMHVFRHFGSVRTYRSMPERWRVRDAVFLSRFYDLSRV